MKDSKLSLAEEEELEDVVTRSVRRTFFESEPFLIGGGALHGC